MKLLVVIVTYNAMQWAERCFASIKNSTVRSYVFVVDNGSTDGTQAFIKGHYPEVMFHQSEENLGFGKANNMGLQYALDHNYDYVYLLNQDAWVQNDTFERLIEISKKYPEYGILSPFQMNADLYHIDHNFIVYVCAWSSNPDIMNDLYNNNLQVIYNVNNVMAAHWFIPIVTIKTIGGFSPSFPHYGEDENYVARAVYKGIKVGVVPSLRVVHDRGEREETKKQNIYMGYINFIKSLSKPQNTILKAFLKSTYIVFRDVFMYTSMMPIKYYFNNLCNLRDLLRNRQISVKCECAFLVKKKTQ